MNFERKYNSKVFLVFEWIFSIVIINIMTILLFIPIITILPAVVAAAATFRQMIIEGPSKLFNSYFRNFVNFSEKAFLSGLMILIISLGLGISFWFYYQRLDQTQFIIQAGFMVMLIGIIIGLLLILHLPLLIITFKKLTVKELFLTSIYITFRYFTSTLIMIIGFAISVIGVYLYPVWIVCGISLPLLMVVFLTRPTYQQLEKIDIEKLFLKAEAAESEDDYE